MRALAQLMTLCVGMCITLPTTTGAQDELPVKTNTIQGLIQATTTDQAIQEAKSLKKVFLSNRTITCNDGSQAGFYLRKSHSSKKWVIFLEGGWYCYDHHSCRNRWDKQRRYMTSSQWPKTRDVGGILSPNQEENPFWYNVNHVFIPYCTSDSWSGTRNSRNETFSFMGAAIVQQVIKDLLQLGLKNGTDLLLTGSSAGGTGVILNLDPVQELLHDVLKIKQISVKGVTDSGWFLDRVPFVSNGKPAVDAIRRGMQHWQGSVPQACRDLYKEEPWRCYFGYRLYPTLKNPLFVFQWLFDEAQMDADNVGPPVTKQQWDYIHKMGDALRKSFANVSAVFAPSCISHSVLTKKEWLRVKIDDISIAEALHCWEEKLLRRKLRKERHLAMKKKKSQEIKKKGRRKGKKRRKNGHKGKKTQTTERPVGRHQRSVLQTQQQKHAKKRLCVHRKLERCSWPQCNHSCPKLHNPFTGEELNFIDLLKSFGLDMDNVALALGIDIHTLNSMDQAELLNLLTQQNN